MEIWIWSGWFRDGDRVFGRAIEQSPKREYTIAVCRREEIRALEHGSPLTCPMPRQSWTPVLVVLAVPVVTPTPLPMAMSPPPYKLSATQWLYMQTLTDDTHGIKCFWFWSPCPRVSLGSCSNCVCVDGACMVLSVVSVTPVSWSLSL